MVKSGTTRSGVNLNGEVSLNCYPMAKLEQPWIKTSLTN